MVALAPDVMSIDMPRNLSLCPIINVPQCSWFGWNMLNGPNGGNFYFLRGIVTYRESVLSAISIVGETYIYFT
jgi:hypothetical protein